MSENEEILAALAELKEELAATKSMVQTLYWQTPQGNMIQLLIAEGNHLDAQRLTQEKP